MTSQRPIAYVSQVFPGLTQTFVYREVLALRRGGLSVKTFAIWRPDPEQVPPEARHLVDDTHYVFPISWPRLIRSHLSMLAGRPSGYLTTLAFVLTRAGESLRNRQRTFFHFCEAVYLAEAMRELQIGHIHAQFSINAATIALVLSRLLEIPFSFQAHNLLFTDRVLLKEKVEAAHFVAAISDYTRKFLIDQVPGRATEAKTHVVHCSIPLPDFAPSDAPPQNRVPTILFVGQLCERKGAPVLVEACRILFERGVTFRCLIVGDGVQAELLEGMVDHYRLSAAVELLGMVHQEELRDLLRRADVFALPCITAENGDVDGIPVALMESMAMEIATVSTAVSGIPELIDDGQSGLLVPEKDPTALADSVQRLLEDEELRRRLGRSGREKIEREFNVDRSAVELAQLFQNDAERDS